MSLARGAFIYLHFDANFFLGCVLFGVVSNWGCKCLVICNLPISRASFFGSAVILKIICFKDVLSSRFLLELLYCDIHSQMAGQGEQ